MGEYKGTVLLVDNSLLFKTLVERLFNDNKNYQLISAKDEIEATLQIPRLDVKLIIIGHNISYGSSLKLLNHIRNNTPYNKLPIMKVSSTLKQNECYNLIKSGINDLISLSDMDFITFAKKTYKLLGEPVMANDIRIFKMEKSSKPAISSNVIDKKQSSQMVTQNKIISQEAIDSRISKIAGVKTLPFIISELLSLTSSVNTDINDLAKVIKTDHALTAKILRLANSICYNRMGTRVYNLKDAIKNIGFNGVKDLAIGLGTIDYFKQKPDEISFNRIGLWYYSFTVGIIAREIAYLVNYSQPETFFMSGLLNNIGLAILDDHFEEEFKKVLEYSIYNNIPIYKAEKDVLGFTHNEISSKLLTKWGFPSNVVIPISLSNRDFSEVFNLETKYEKYKRNVVFIKLSENLARVISGGLLKTDIIEELPDKLFKYPYINVSLEDMYANLSDVNKNVRDMVQSSLRHVEPEVLFQCNAFNKYKSDKKQKTIITESGTSSTYSLENILHSINHQIIIATDNLMDLINKECPENIIFDISSFNENHYNTEYIRDIALNESCNIAVVVNKHQYDHFYKNLNDTQNIVFIEKPIMITELCNCIEFFQR
ncbi:MAG: response regulator [Cyanobacteriota bacterium]